MANDSIVTKEMLESYRSKHWILEGELTYNTITQAVELLERTQARMHNKLLDTSIFDDVKQANDAFLARYHAGEICPLREVREAAAPEEVGR